MVHKYNLDSFVHETSHKAITFSLYLRFSQSCEKFLSAKTVKLQNLSDGLDREWGVIMKGPQVETI